MPQFGLEILLVEDIPINMQVALQMLKGIGCNVETAENGQQALDSIAATKPDIAETTYFFLSLLPDQLRPQITYRWRQLIARLLR